MSDDADKLFREYLREEHQDDVTHYLTPSRPSAIAELSIPELQRLYRKLAFANRHAWARQIELELIGRFTGALEYFSEASAIASKKLTLLTWVLVVLTVMVAAFTIALFFRG
jgi:hypothetical protein